MTARTTLAVAAALLAGAAGAATPADDRQAVSQLDVAYQAAVKRNDADAMDRIFDPNFVLILGNGTVASREKLLDNARTKKIIYELQDEQPGSQMVHLYGDTAVVTALLLLKGSNAGQPFDRKLWFSDTYVRRADGWHYALGQASLPIAAEAPAK